MIESIVNKRTKRILLAFTIFLAAIFAMPLYNLFKRSLGFAGFENYTKVIQLEYFDAFFVNSLLIACSTLVIRIAVVSLAAYAFSKMKFPGRNQLFVIGIIGLFTPPFTLLVSLFQTVKGMNLLDSWIGVSLPLVSFGIGFNLLLFKNYFDTIPNELFEAADIDGASHWDKFRNIILPLGRPAIITGSIFTFINSWNEFFLPLLLVRQTKNFPLTLSPYFFVSAYTSDYSKVYAAMILISIPIILVYLINQRFVESGLTGGAVKG